MGGPFSPTSKSGGGGGGVSKGHYSGGKSSEGGAEVSFPSAFFPDRAEEVRVGERHKHEERSLFCRIRAGRERRYRSPAPPSPKPSRRLRIWSVNRCGGCRECGWGSGGCRRQACPALEDRLRCGERAPGPRGRNHWSASPKTSFCLRFMFSKSKAEPAMRL